jgi:hypothetical protein
VTLRRKFEKEQFMKRLLTLLSVAGLTAAVACGDDSGGGKPVSTPDAGMDAGSKPVVDTGVGVVVRPVQVENPGAACTAASTTDCKGAAPTCNENLMLGQQSIKLEGGYCSAQCTASAECSAGGGCPAAEITASLPEELVSLAGPALSGLIPSSCLDKCDKAADVCRSGYECKTIAELIPQMFSAFAGFLTSGPAFKQAYCLPPINIVLPDAGAFPGFPVDAGVRTLDGGADGGL